MKKLFAQLIKFGLVGGICFLVDYLIGLASLNIIIACTSQSFFEIASIIASAIGFVISVILNYYLSFKFVFQRKEDLNRKVEFIVFVVLSFIGLLLNSLIIWIGVGPIYSASEFLQQNVHYNLVYTGAKVCAAAIVMVYNFVTRKMFLEQKD